MVLNQGQVASCKATALNEILAPYGLKACAVGRGTETRHLTRGLIRKEWVDEWLEGDFFKAIDIGNGVIFNYSLSYDFGKSPYIIWKNDEPIIPDIDKFLLHLKTLFIRKCNRGYLPGDKVVVDLKSPKASSLAFEMFPELRDSMKVSVLEWKGLHYIAFKNLFPATYKGCRRVSQDNYKLILESKDGEEFEIPEDIAIV